MNIYNILSKIKILIFLFSFFLIFSTCEKFHESVYYSSELPRHLKNLQQGTYIKVEHTKLRLSPYINSTILELLSKNLYVKILDRSVKKQRIGKANSFWYKIQTNNGIIGWTYGENLEKEY